MALKLRTAGSNWTGILTVWWDLSELSFLSEIAPKVFMYIVTNRKASEKHYRRIEQFAPKTGTVRLLRLTEKQYQNIYMVSGEADYQEKTVGSNCHIML